MTFFIIFNNPENSEEAELRTSTCDLLSKLELFQFGFRLCGGSEKSTGLSVDDVFIEPFGESRDGHIVVRSRKCEFMLEMEEMFSSEKLDVDRTCCIHCGLLQNSATCVKPEPKRNEYQIDEESDHYEE